MRKTFDLGNVVTAMVTPFSDNELMDFVGAGDLALHLVRTGSDSLLLAGSTGEAAQLSDDEKWALIDHVRTVLSKDSQAKDTKIMVAVGNQNAEKAAQSAQLAFSKWGADAILCAPPPYIKPPQSSLVKYFDTIAKAVPDKPVYLYNIPGRTAVEILPETVVEIASANPNIIGIKQSMGDMDKVSELRSLLDEASKSKSPAKKDLSNFQIYSGDDSLTLPMLALGARGVISVASHLEGQLIHQMINSFNRGDIKQAREIHTLLFPLYKALFMTTNPIPVKAALHLRGLIQSPALRTLLPLNAQQQEDLKNRLCQFNRTKSAYVKQNPILQAAHVRD